MTSTIQVWTQPITTRVGALVALIVMVAAVAALGNPSRLLSIYFPESIGILIGVVIAIVLNLHVWGSQVRIVDQELIVRNVLRRHDLELNEVRSLHPREWGTIIGVAGYPRPVRAWALPKQFTPRVVSMVSATDQACIDIALAARQAGATVELIDVRMKDRWGAGWPSGLEPPPVRYTDD